MLPKACAITMRNPRAQLFREEHKVGLSGPESSSTESFGEEAVSYPDTDIFSLAANGNPQPTKAQGHGENDRVNARDFGVNLAAFASQTFGVAESAKQLAYALRAVEIPFVVNEIVSSHSMRDKTLKAYMSDDNPYPVNIIHANPPETQSFFTSKPSSYFEDRVNVGIWYWELQSFPSKWIPCFKLFDEVWVTSRFIEKTLAEVSTVPIVKLPFPLTMDTPISQFPREKFGLRENTCAFVFAFDYRSEFERKNPLAVVRAFRRAFDSRDDAVLIINTINSHVDPENSRRLREAAHEARVFIFDGHLTRQDYIALLRAGDCYVSLHRSEGLGMTMAQSMYLGKPVIATGYSGNLDFMNKDNSLLVRFNIVELESSYGPYEKGNVWADPDLNEACELMRWVYEHPSESRQLGERASRDVRELMDPKVVGSEIRSRLRMLIEKRNAQTS